MCEKNNSNLKSNLRDNLKIYDELYYNSENGACHYKSSGDNDVFGYYNGFQFFIEHDRKKLIRVTFTQMDDSTKELEMIKQLYTAGHCLSEIYGKPTVYYDRLIYYEECDFETVNPTLEWCLDKENEDEFVRSIINDCHLPNDRCINIRLFTGKRIEYYKLGSQYTIKK